MSKFQDPVLYFVSDFIEVLSHICLWPFSMNAKRETKNSGINGRVEKELRTVFFFVQIHLFVH